MDNETHVYVYEQLKERELLEYGSIFSVSDLYVLMKLGTPLTIADYKAVALQELAATDYVRDILISEGKYLKRDGEHYKVLLASENMSQVKNYMASANRKLRRADRLSKNTPSEFRTDSNNAIEIRLQKKLDSAKAKETHDELLK